MMKKVRVRVVLVLRSISRSSVATSSPPTDQVHFFCQMMLLCRSRLAAIWKVRAADERQVEIIDQIGVIDVAGMKARDLLDVLRAEQRPPVDEYASELPLAVRIDGQGQACSVRRMIDRDVELAEIGEGIAAAAELDL